VRGEAEVHDSSEELREWLGPLKEKKALGVEAVETKLSKLSHKANDLS
jgi:hypothetical protein